MIVIHIYHLLAGFGCHDVASLLVIPFDVSSRDVPRRLSCVRSNWICPHDSHHTQAHGPRLVRSTSLRYIRANSDLTDTFLINNDEIRGSDLLVLTIDCISGVTRVTHRPAMVDFRPTAFRCWIKSIASATNEKVRIAFGHDGPSKFTGTYNKIPTTHDMTLYCALYLSTYYPQ